jgi:hypothetical protein
MTEQSRYFGSGARQNLLVCLFVLGSMGCTLRAGEVPAGGVVTRLRYRIDTERIDTVGNQKTRRADSSRRMCNPD